jgi:RNA recognition motif-containing protein
LKFVYVQKTSSKKSEATPKLLAFVCFKDPDTAAKAVEEMHLKEIDGHRIYVAEALKKQQLAKEIFKFKNAKKRCNLFVKGFPSDTDEDKLTEFFEGLTHSGAIENIKLEMDKNDPTKARYAFVCFKSPDLANQVKQHIANNPQQMLGGSRLFVNNYEPKETRMIQQAEARDRADYANATSQVNGNISQVDQLFQKPELVQTLMFIMQHLQSQGRPMGGRGGHIRQAGPPRGNFQGAPQMGRQPYVHNRP